MDRELQSALTKAVGALSRRERTISELNEWLIDRGVSAEIAGEAVAELIEIGELDDERFAHAFAEDKRELAGWGNARIEAALLDRGIPRALAEGASVEPRESELARATDLARSRGEDLEDERAKARVLSFLTRRGYEYETAYDAVRRAAERGSAAA